MIRLKSNFLKVFKFGIQTEKRTMKNIILTFCIFLMYPIRKRGKNAINLEKYIRA